MSAYYPEQRPALKLSVIQREVMLPEDASGIVAVQADQRVDIRDVIARGLVPGQFMVVEAARYFGLDDPDDLTALMLVNIDDEVDELKPLAGLKSGRGKRLMSPTAGRVAAIADGLIVIEKLNQVIDLEAGVRGTVKEVRLGRGVVIEANGARVQGVWGNGRHAIAAVINEGANPLEKTTADVLGSRFSSAIAVVRRPLTEEILDAAAAQNVAGLIAPSMSVDLLDWALFQPYALMLVEGFGQMRLNRAVAQLLQDLEGMQITLDAVQPQVWSARRPEAVMNVQARAGESIARSSVNLTLRVGMSVRAVGGAYGGMLGNVVNLPNDPILLDNGLRVPCALVELGGDAGKLYVPLANLEVIG
jgi:hypothetical protein